MVREIINVIAGGPSIREMNLDMDKVLDTGFTIGVNQSCVDYDVDCALTMDRLFMENRYELLKSKGIETHFRRCAWKLGHTWEQLNLFEGDIESEFMSDKEHILAGNNSGACGINLAYKMRPRKIFLFGFDMRVGTDGRHHHHNEYEWGKKKLSDSKYHHWTKDNRFLNIMNQCREQGIEIFNVSPNSKISHIPKLDWKAYQSVLKT